MKQTLLVLNIVLLAAVGVLFYLHFSNNSTETSNEMSATDGPRVQSAVAFVNTDSLLEKYEYSREMREQLEAKTKKLDQDFQNRVNALQSDIRAYERRVNTMTLGQVRAAEEDIARKRNNLQLYEQSLGQQLMEEQAKLNQALYERVTQYLKKYGEENGIQMVLKFNPTSDVLYAGDAIDITHDVIRGLNDSYQQEKSPAKPANATKEKADTTKQK